MNFPAISDETNTITRGNARVCSIWFMGCHFELDLFSYAWIYNSAPEPTLLWRERGYSDFHILSGDLASVVIF